MDIVERLRKRAATWVSVGWGNNDIFDEAANEIERLRNKVQWLEMCENTVVKQNAEIERLREALQKIATTKTNYKGRVRHLFDAVVKIAEDALGNDNLKMTKPRWRKRPVLKEGE